MKRLIVILIVLGLVGAGLSFVAGPWMAFRALRAGAAAHDPQAIADVSDFHEIRASLRTQVGDPLPNAPPPSFWENPLGAIRGALGVETPAQRANVDSYLTPQALEVLTNAKADKAKKPKDAPFMAGDIIPGLHQSEVRFWDSHRTRIAVLAEGNPQYEAIFTFERRSLFSWKLVHIRLPGPAEKPGETPAAAPAK